MGEAMHGLLRQQGRADVAWVRLPSCPRKGHVCGSQPPPIGDRVLTMGRLTGMGALHTPSQRALGAAQAVGIDFPTNAALLFQIKTLG